MLESLFNKVFEETPTQAFTCEYRETVNTCFEEHVRTAGCFCTFLLCFQVIHFPYILFVFVIQLRSKELCPFMTGTLLLPCNE